MLTDFSSARSLIAMEVTRLWFALILGTGSIGCVTREREVARCRNQRFPLGHSFRKTDGTGGVQYTSYWSSTTRALAAEADSTDFPNAWYLGLPSGVVHYNTNAANEDVDPDCEPDNCLDKRTLRGVWPVKGPRPIVSPPP
jgi:hypothetical protein